MDELRKTVLRGKFNPIPNFYTPELTTLLKMLLVLNPQGRPSAEKLLADPILVSKIKEFQEVKLEDLNKQDIKLLGTIKVPWN